MFGVEAVEAPEVGKLLGKASNDDIVITGKGRRDSSKNQKRKVDDLKKEEKEFDKLSKTANSSENYSANKAKITDKIYDFASKTIKDFEDKIKQLNKEDGLLVNEHGNLILKHKGKKYSNKIDWNNYSIEQLRGSIITHNHPNSSGLSLGDIRMFLHQELKEIRAVCKDGTVYSMKNMKISNKVRNELITKLEIIEEEWRLLQRTAKISSDFVEMKIFTKFYYEIEPFVEYTKYTN